MGRIKLYDREAVLEAAMLLFWQRGFADTSLQMLQQATGMHKSGLYAEFESKEALFLAALRHYLDGRASEGLLLKEPPGWRNVETLLRAGPACAPGRRGCFAINAMRELPSLPPDAAELVRSSQAGLLDLLTTNIAAENPRLPARAIAEIVLVFFSGLCIEMNLDPAPRTVQRKIRHFMAMLKEM